MLLVKLLVVLVLASHVVASHVLGSHVLGSHVLGSHVLASHVLASALLDCVFMLGDCKCPCLSCRPPVYSKMFFNLCKAIGIFLPIINFSIARLHVKPKIL